MIRYADNKAVVASSQKGLQELMNRLNDVTKEHGIKITKVKITKVTCISRKGKSKVRLLIDDQQVEQLSQFKYLGSWISLSSSSSSSSMNFQCAYYSLNIGAIHESDKTLKMEGLKSLKIKSSSKKVSLQLLSELR